MYADDRWLLAVAFMAELCGITEHAVCCRAVAVQSGVRAVTLDDGRPFEGQGAGRNRFLKCESGYSYTV
jgi:hypothetical protein